MIMGLHEMACSVQEINLWGSSKHVHNPHRLTGGFGPVYVKLDRIGRRIGEFDPHIVLLCGGGLTFFRDDMARARNRCPVVGITLSDPDVFPAVSRYASMFGHHTTNSKLALRWYLERGARNTSLMPFAADSRFFVPRAAQEEYRADVAIVGHGRSGRIELAERLRQEFDARIYGRNWPWPNAHPVQGEDWFRAVTSARCVVNFPRTVAGHVNVKVGVFEVVATGRLLFTEHFEEMAAYFRYGEEIVGYAGVDDLVEKIRYYIERPGEADRIARAGQLRCARDHTWQSRLTGLFSLLKVV